MASRNKTPKAKEPEAPPRQFWPADQVEHRQLAVLVPFARNTRTHSEGQIKLIMGSMTEWGWTMPILVDEHDGIIAGHARVMAADRLGFAGLREVPVVVARGWSAAKKRAYVIADNRLAEAGAGWDEELLALELGDLQMEGFDLGLIGFDADALDSLLGTSAGAEGEGAAEAKAKLADKFMLPPFSVLNAREGGWQDRKRAWLALGIQSELGRGAPTGGSPEPLARLRNGRKANAIPSGAPMPLDRAKDEKAARKASPGGNRMPATDYSKSHAKGDGRGKAIAAASAIVGPGLTPIEERGGIWLKREDLWRVGGAVGGKARTCLVLAAGAPGLVTAGSRASPQCNIVAQVAKHMGIPVRVHTPQGDLGAELVAAKFAGAEIVQHKAGYNNVIIARAREDAAALGWREIPFGMECAEAVKQTRAQVRDIPEGVQRIVIPVGSGMSLAGLLWGLKDLGRELPVLGVRVGADPAKRLAEYAPPGWRAGVTLQASGTDYHDPVHADAQGVRLDPYYEAKCVPFLRAGDLLWVVGIRATEIRDGEK